MTLVDLLSPSRRTRIDAIRDLPDSDTLRFALRRVLFTDNHAEVRANAARRLGQFADVDGWLLDAVDDASPLVRDAVLRSLARAGTTDASPKLRRIIDGDHMWWVRRAAIYALASIAGEAEVATFTRALGDPFWRVRHAAVKVLAVLGAAHPELRDEVIESSADSTTLAFLRASWGPVAIEAPARAVSPSALPPALLDPDPAVVTARLATGTFEPLALVELLCDPHVPLRSLAAKRVADSRDREALIAALDWLEEPRIPHVVDTVHRLLDGFGDLALEIAEHALAAPGRRGAARWAISWVVATWSETLFEPALARAREDLELRRHALRLASDRELLTWADDEFLIDAIAVELHERRRPLSHDALLALDGKHHPRVRALQLDVHARRGHMDVVRAALDDEHHGPRAVAARWCVRSSPLDALVPDLDPAVREAALTVESAVRFTTEEDPWVRRAAIEMLANAWHAREAPADVHAATGAALADADPWIRARAGALPIVDDLALARVLALVADKDEMVRSAALDALGHIDGARVRTLLPTLDGIAERIATTLAALDEPDDRMREMLAAIEMPPPRPRIEPVYREPIARPSIERRTFGRAGFDVAPLAISGAYDLSARGLAQADEAGVDLYFWEPGYEVLARFLRARARRELRVVTGTYHADAASIRGDVERALRVLRRDTLDAFLLFWTRSPARLDAEAYAVLDSLKHEGKVRAIGFSTHHRDMAREAIERTPWDVVMIRHSAAHPGIETAFLPTARESRTAVLTFSALCYGRMVSGTNAPTAAECYRYTLSQPGVTACISAPRRWREVSENLTVLAEPTLPAHRIAELRQFGQGVHAESSRFNALLRQPTRDAAAAARELLAAEMPPSDALPTTRHMPRPAGAKRSRTRLGRR